MSDLLVPGDERAGDLFSDTAVLAALLRVEQAWLDTLVDLGVAPAKASADLERAVAPADLPGLSSAAEVTGNPVPALAAMLRARTPSQAAEWIHRGLTSQDVLDTALVLMLRQVFAQLQSQFAAQIDLLCDLASTHTGTLAVARTLGRPAVPTTFGTVACGWAHAVLDAADDLETAAGRLTVQAGGAGGTWAAAEFLATGSGTTGEALAKAWATRLDLPVGAPWHTRRRPMTAAGDALVACCDAWAKIAGDVLARSRPEVGELVETSAGGSSTMPHKQNPVHAVLIRRSALQTPYLGAVLHGCAAGATEERPVGEWHAEWPTLRTLARSTATAASLTTSMLAGLHVDVERMRRTAEAAADDLLAERRALSPLVPGAVGGSLGSYVGVPERAVEVLLARARDRRSS